MYSAFCLFPQWLWSFSVYCLKHKPAHNCRPGVSTMCLDKQLFCLFYRCIHLFCLMENLPFKKCTTHCSLYHCPLCLELCRLGSSITFMCIEKMQSPLKVIIFIKKNTFVCVCVCCCCYFLTCL